MAATLTEIVMFSTHHQFGFFALSYESLKISDFHEVVVLFEPDGLEILRGDIDLKEKPKI